MVLIENKVSSELSSSSVNNVKITKIKFNEMQISHLWYTLILAFHSFLFHLNFLKQNSLNGNFCACVDE